MFIPMRDAYTDDPADLRSSIEDILANLRGLTGQLNDNSTKSVLVKDINVHEYAGDNAQDINNIISTLNEIKAILKGE